MPIMHNARMINARNEERQTRQGRGEYYLAFAALDILAFLAFIIRHFWHSSFIIHLSLAGKARASFFLAAPSASAAIMASMMLSGVTLNGW